MTENTERGIKIVAGIANTAAAVNQTFGQEDLNMLLKLFDHHPSKDGADYKRPLGLVQEAYNEHNRPGCFETAENIKAAFPWFKPKPDPAV